MSDNEAATEHQEIDEFAEEEAEREERNQIWQCFMQYDID
jgi:calmodulin